MAVLFAAAAAGLFLIQNQTARAVEDSIVFDEILPAIERSRRNRFHAYRRRCRTRRTWSSFIDDLSDRQFRRYFRMSKCLFGILCRRIEEIFGAEKFMSEDHANALLSSQHADQSRNIYFAHAKSTGGVISGEVKLASALRILGGGPTWTWQ